MDHGCEVRFLVAPQYTTRVTRMCTASGLGEYIVDVDGGLIIIFRDGIGRGLRRFTSDDFVGVDPDRLGGILSKFLLATFSPLSGVVENFGLFFLG
jgi:hypothetical protein